MSVLSDQAFEVNGAVARTSRDTDYSSVLLIFFKSKMSQSKVIKQFTDAIDHLDRKLVRKLIFEKQVKLHSIADYSVKILLKISAQSRDAPFLQEILEQKPDLSTPFGARLLWMVVEDADTEVASMLVRSGADVNVPQFSKPSKPSFLHVLASSESPKKLELAKLMMEHGADVMAKDADGCSVFEYVIKHNNFPLASELLQRDALVDEFVLHEAIRSSKTVAWLSFLVEGCAHNETKKNESIASMFSWLCEMDYDQDKISEYLVTLLKLGVPDISVIFKSVLSRKMQLTKAVLDSDIDGNTKMLLLHAAVTLESSDIASMLINWGANVEHRMEMEVLGFGKGYCPLHVACSYGSLANVDLLLRHGADINVIADDGWTAFEMLLYFYPDLNEVNQLFIKHLAMLTTKGIKINNNDIEMISNNSNYQMFYENCLAELQAMKKVKILNSINYYSILSKDVKELSLLTRRENFVKNYELSLSSGLFPLYSKNLEFLYRRAENRKNHLSDTEDVLYESLGQVLPVLAIEKILFYVYFSDIHV